MMAATESVGGSIASDSSQHTGLTGDDCWVDLSGDGGVLKRILRPGTADEGHEAPPKPPDGAPCTLQVVGRRPDGSIFDTTRDVVNGKHVGGTDDPVEFKLGRDDTSQPIGFDIAVASMSKSELAEFKFGPKYTFRSASDAAEAGTTLDATLWYELELESWGTPLMKLPSKAEMEAARREREEEEARMAEKEPPDDERIARAAEFKEQGNKNLKDGDLEAAKRSYDTAFVNIFIHPKVWESGALPKEVVAKYQAIKLPLHLNRALVSLKRGELVDATHDCDRALEIDPDNVKGRYRRGLIHLARLLQLLAKEDSGEYWDPDNGPPIVEAARADLDHALRIAPDNKAVQRALRDLQRAELRLRKLAKEYGRQRDKLFRERMAGGVLRTGASDGRDASGAAGAAAPAEGDDGNDDDDDDSLPDLA